MRVVITGGGTGGHVYPGLAIAEALRARVPAVEILFIGGQGLERGIVPQEGWPFARVASAPWPRGLSLRTPWAAAVMAVGVTQAVGVLRRFRPQTVVGTGGYASAPVGVAAAVLRVPLVVQEQNIIPGATNRLLGRWARAVSVPHATVSGYFPGRAVVTGVPLRQRALRGDRRRGLQRFGLDDGVFTVLVLGGSLGAASLNAAVADMVGRIPSGFEVQFLHQTGKEHEEWVRRQLHMVASRARKYIAEAYIEDVADAYACADLVICRSGAGTMAEVTAHGLPVIAVPYPFGVAGEQEANARVLEAAGAAVVILYTDLSGQRLVQELAALRDPARREAMAAASRSLGHPQAADAVAGLVLQAAA